MRLLLAILLLTTPLFACSDSATAATANGEAAGGCEAATDALLVTQDTMLPGRQCLVCHKAGGEAQDEALSAGGTVFSKGSDACNGGGISGAVVELLKADGSTVASATTNAAGNFRFRQALDFSAGQLKARVTYNGKTHDMPDPVTTGDCASCHNTKVEPRINVE